VREATSLASSLGGTEGVGVSQLTHRYAVVVNDVLEELPCPDRTQHVVDPNTALGKDRVAKGSTRVHDHLVLPRYCGSRIRAA
jgi:hypothetical protein